jgi:hypothetical protein
MRRRSRRPTRPLEDAHAQVLADAHQPTPEEQVSGAERGSVARDILASLPQRRRAVMLLRYGWGLSPNEICSLVANLSPRAYRKEITRGVGEMIDRLKQVDSGEWCDSREPLLREYVAGTAGEEVRRQAAAHLGHCRGCSDLVARLNGQLSDIGSAVAWTSVAGSLGEERLALTERMVGGIDRAREAGARAFERGESAASDAGTAIASGGGSRGAGVAGAGALAKLAGLGTAGKAAIACLGAGAAATACVAAGVVPGVGPGQADGEQRGKGLAIEKVRDSAEKATNVPAGLVPVTDRPEAAKGPGGSDGSANHEKRHDGGEVEVEATVAPDGAPAGSPAPAAPPVEQEFGVAGAATSPSGTGGGGGSGGAGGTKPSGSDVGREFGP